MTSKQEFSEEEWTRIRRAPLVAGLAISIADPGGPIEITKETMASLKAATAPPSQEALLVAVSQDLTKVAQEKENPMGDFTVDKGALAGQQILDELREVNEIVTSKATAEEAEAFRRWMVAVAQAAADAAKEGGFLGFGAEQVSQGERNMLEQLGAALGVRP
jgi:transcription antitermination factor NusG